jgi:hypothetical protein
VAKLCERGRGVAIKSTVGRLRAALSGSTGHFADGDESRRIALPVAYIGRITYIQPERLVLEGEHQVPVARFFVKRPE